MVGIIKSYNGFFIILSQYNKSARAINIGSAVQSVGRSSIVFSGALCECQCYIQEQEGTIEQS